MNEKDKLIQYLCQKASSSRRALVEQNVISGGGGAGGGSFFSANRNEERLSSMTLSEDELTVLGINDCTHNDYVNALNVLNNYHIPSVPDTDDDLLDSLDSLNSVDLVDSVDSIDVHAKRIPFNYLEMKSNYQNHTINQEIKEISSVFQSSYGGPSREALLLESRLLEEDAKRFQIEAERAECLEKDFYNFQLPMIRQKLIRNRKYDDSGRSLLKKPLTINRHIGILNEQALSKDFPSMNTIDLQHNCLPQDINIDLDLGMIQRSSLSQFAELKRITLSPDSHLPSHSYLLNLTGLPEEIKAPIIRIINSSGRQSSSLSATNIFIKNSLYQMPRIATSSLDTYKFNPLALNQKLELSHGRILKTTRKIVKIAKPIDPIKISDTKETKNPLELIPCMNGTDNYPSEVPKFEKSNPTSCQNSRYECSLPVLEGEAYCLRHILQDRYAPYKRCSFRYTNGKCCLNARKLDSDYKFCSLHSGKPPITLTEIDLSLHIETNENYLNQLKSHVECEDDEFIEVDDDNQDNIDGHDNAERMKDSLDASIKPPPIKNKKKKVQGQTFLKGPVLPDFIDDDEISSDGSETDSPLKHAGVFTEQEILDMALEKNYRLYQLLAEEEDRIKQDVADLTHYYRPKIESERKTLCNPSKQERNSPEEIRCYREYKALKQFHCRTGLKEVMQMKRKEKLNRTSIDSPKLIFHSMCCYVNEFKVKCTNNRLTPSRYCPSHITRDRKQTLFKECPFKMGDTVCKISFIPVIDGVNECHLHRRIPKISKIQRTIY